jgi:hypothetical protein
LDLRGTMWQEGGENYIMKSSLYSSPNITRMTESMR